MWSSPSQHIYNDVYWTDRMEHSILRGGPLNQCYALGTVHGAEVGKESYAGPKPPGFDALVAEWMYDPKAFERVCRAIFGSYYAICFLCQSYGDQWDQPGAPGYGTDASGAIQLFHRTSTMPTDHNFQYDLTNNHYDRAGRQTITINDWHEAREADWVDRGYLDGTGHEAYGGWHLPFDPSWHGVLGGTTGYGGPNADQALQGVPMQMGMLSISACDHDSEQANGDQSPASKGSMVLACAF